MATLVPAKKEDLYFPTGEVKESTVVFEKSAKDGRFSGPHFLEVHSLGAIVCLACRDWFYIIKRGHNYTAGEVTFKLALRRAEVNDFRWSPYYPRWGRLYYTSTDKAMVYGPHYLTEDTDKKQLAAQLQDGHIWVPAEGQQFYAQHYTALAS